MIIYAVDDERGPLMLLGETLREVEPRASIKLFQDPMAMLREAEEVPCDIAFLDIQMRNVDGLLLAKKLTEGALAKNIIFVTSFDEYALEALKLYASGYLLKPARPDDVREALKHLRVPIITESTRIKVRTFGGFEVTVEDKPVKFKRSKSAELLAFLVDKRGKSVTAEEILFELWEDGDYDEARARYLRTLLSALRKDLEAADADDMLDNIGAIPTVKPDTFWCDAYALMDGDPVAAKEFQGNYLPQYSWAEFTNATLCRTADFF